MINRWVVHYLKAIKVSHFSLAEGHSKANLQNLVGEWKERWVIKSKTKGNVLNKINDEKSDQFDHDKWCNNKFMENENKYIRKNKIEYRFWTSIEKSSASMKLP